MLQQHKDRKGRNIVECSPKTPFSQYLLAMLGGMVKSWPGTLLYGAMCTWLAFFLLGAFLAVIAFYTVGFGTH